MEEHEKSQSNWLPLETGICSIRKTKKIATFGVSCLSSPRFFYIRFIDAAGMLEIDNWLRIGMDYKPLISYKQLLFSV
jgi:hypothetical protein